MGQLVQAKSTAVMPSGLVASKAMPAQSGGVANHPTGSMRSTAPASTSGSTGGAGVSGAETRQFLTFVLGGEMYAIGILHIKEIIEYGQLTEVPMMPSTIRGVINLRGAVVPVVDLAARFSGKVSAVQRRTCIVIVEVMQDDVRLDIGVMVDAVSEVLEIARSEIEPPPSFGAKIRADFIDGMGKVAGKFVIILNINRVLSADDLAAAVGAAGG